MSSSSSLGIDNDETVFRGSHIYQTQVNDILHTFGINLDLPFSTLADSFNRDEYRDFTDHAWDPRSDRAYRKYFRIQYLGAVYRSLTALKMTPVQQRVVLRKSIFRSHDTERQMLKTYMDFIWYNDSVFASEEARSLASTSLNVFFEVYRQCLINEHLYDEKVYDHYWADELRLQPKRIETTHLNKHRLQQWYKPLVYEKGYNANLCISAPEYTFIKLQQNIREIRNGRCLTDTFLMFVLNELFAEHDISSISKLDVGESTEPDMAARCRFNVLMYMFYTPVGKRKWVRVSDLLMGINSSMYMGLHIAAMQHVKQTMDKFRLDIGNELSTVELPEARRRIQKELASHDSKTYAVAERIKRVATPNEPKSNKSTPITVTITKPLLPTHFTHINRSTHLSESQDRQALLARFRRAQQAASEQLTQRSWVSDAVSLPFVEELSDDDSEHPRIDEDEVSAKRSRKL